MIISLFVTTWEIYFRVLLLFRIHVYGVDFVHKMHNTTYQNAVSVYIPFLYPLSKKNQIILVNPPISMIKESISLKASYASFS